MSDVSKGPRALKKRFQELYVEHGCSRAADEAMAKILTDEGFKTPGHGNPFTYATIQYYRGKWGLVSKRYNRKGKTKHVEVPVTKARISGDDFLELTTLVLASKLSNSTKRKVLSELYKDC